MAIMDRIYLHEIDSQYVSKVSEESGVIRFFSNTDLLYITDAVNLKNKMIKLFSRKEEDLNLRELFRNSLYIQIDETPNALDALLSAKLILEKGKPEFNQIINEWKEYVYLAINPTEFPYVKITEYTEEEWFYLGPFKNRFFLKDIMELMSKLLQLPHCDDKQGPCGKQNNSLCRGWCMLVKSELSIDPEDKIETPNISKLDALLKEAYVHPDNGLLEMIQIEKNKYEDSLQFIKADLLSTQIDLLKRYKNWLIFLYKAKIMSFESKKVKVRNGQLIGFNMDGIEHYNPFIEIPYRPNEILAMNKNLVDDAWILYQESL